MVAAAAAGGGAPRVGARAPLRASPLPIGGREGGRGWGVGASLCLVAAAAALIETAAAAAAAGYCYKWPGSPLGRWDVRTNVTSGWKVPPAVRRVTPVVIVDSDES